MLYYSKTKIVGNSSLKRRICALEQSTPPRDAPMLVIIGCVGRDNDELIGVTGLSLPRLAHETAQEFIARLEAHIRKTRGRRVPYIGLALFADDVD